MTATYPDPSSYAISKMRDTITAQINTIESLNNRIASLENSIARAEKYLSSAFGDDDLDERIFTDVADIFGWKTTKEINVTVTAVWSGTITVPIGTDTDYLDENFDVECNLHREFDGYLDINSVEVEVN